MASSPLPAHSPRALWLRSRCCNFVLVISAGLMCSADRSVKLFPDSLRRTRLPFSLSISAMASAPSSPSLLSERSTSANDKTSLRRMMGREWKERRQKWKNSAICRAKRDAWQSWRCFRLQFYHLLHVQFAIWVNILSSAKKGFNQPQ